MVPIDPLSDEKVVDSWRTNAAPWTAAVRAREIESRRLVTDAAIVDAVMSVAPGRVLDVGCGEGWLARALASRGVSVTGVDAVPELVERARQLGGGDFRVMSYEDIAQGHLRERFDAVVANFALIGAEAVDALIATTPALLVPGGTLLIQTLHPVVVNGDHPYEDGWRSGSWAGFSADFSDPAPWFFRTMESWERLITVSGLKVTERREPPNPATGKPASVIFIARN
jgi:2-polyprenyl-3-methyl-5-hydroxy-6-metoxy-1,4-benzoquinol methylase